MKKFYFDTSIWLDLFEDRNEHNFPKGKWAKELVSNIVLNNYKILYSTVVLFELQEIGFTRYEINSLFRPFRNILLFVNTSKKQANKARDLGLKRKIPKGDAFHALIARDNKAILVTFDKHFQKILDITKPHKPNDLV